MAAEDAPTTITIPTHVRKALEQYREKGKTYGDVIRDFMEQIPSPAFLKEMTRREQEEPRIALEEFRRRHRLPDAV